MRLHVVPEPARAEFRRDDDGTAAMERREGRGDQSMNVKQRHYAIADVLRPAFELSATVVAAARASTGAAAPLSASRWCHWCEEAGRRRPPREAALTTARRPHEVACGVWDQPRDAIPRSRDPRPPHERGHGLIEVEDRPRLDLGEIFGELVRCVPRIQRSCSDTAAKWRPGR